MKCEISRGSGKISQECGISNVFNSMENDLLFEDSDGLVFSRENPVMMQENQLDSSSKNRFPGEQFPCF